MSLSPLPENPGWLPPAPTGSSQGENIKRIMDMASSRSPQSPPLRNQGLIGAESWSLTSKLAELWQYRELFYFLVWRDVKVRYAQSILGIGWAVIQPLVPMILFTIIFGRVAKISSDGIPYALFSLTGLVPWTYFSNALNDSSGSLVKEVNMLNKIYFPRLIIPLTSVLGRLIDLVISFVLLFLLMAWYRTIPTPWVVLLPLLTAMAIVTASGLGLWLSALAVQYRDVRYGLPFVVPFLMYAAPVVYPTSLIPERFRYFYAINPLVGVIEGYRSTLLGSGPVPWDLIGIGGASALLMLWLGSVYFIGKEPVFADVA
jgi:lipopolysaccharide transport system permease protein